MATLNLNAELLRDLSIIAEDDNLSAKLLSYIKKLITAKKKDESLLTSQEFYSKLDEAEREIAEGKGIEMRPDESLDDLINRIG